MLRLASQITDTNIISVHAGGVIGRLQDIIINPHDLTVAAFWVERPNSEEREVLLVQDIREFSFQGCVIDHEEEIMLASELIRLQELLKINYQLVGKQVRTESKKKLGKVEDYVVSVASFGIQKIHVKQPAWRSLSQSALVVDRKQVVEVTDDKIVVADARVDNKQPVGAPVPTPEI